MFHPLSGFLTKHIRTFFQNGFLSLFSTEPNPLGNECGEGGGYKKIVPDEISQ